MTYSATAVSPMSHQDHVATEEFRALAMQASELVNPKSGIANDYLNTFNEILLLIENLPVLLPEMVDELRRPTGYREYFQASSLPGSRVALAIYDGLPEQVRGHFERMIEAVNEVALASVDTIKAHRCPEGTIEPDNVSDYCEKAAADMRLQLEQLSDFVNNGYQASAETPQDMADRIMGIAASSR